MTWWLRSGTMPDSYASFVLATLACGAGVEVGMRLLPRVVRGAGNDAWQREVGWFAVVTALSEFLFFSLLPGTLVFMPPLLWIGAGLVGALGWFFGDMIQQWLFLRKMGIRRPTRP